jgi:hypothetical protein
MQNSSTKQHVVQRDLNGCFRCSKPQDSITYGRGVTFQGPSKPQDSITYGTGVTFQGPSKPQYSITYGRGVTFQGTSKPQDSITYGRGVTFQGTSKPQDSIIYGRGVTFQGSSGNIFYYSISVRFVNAPKYFIYSIFLSLIIIYLTASVLSPDGSGYYAYT